MNSFFPPSPQIRLSTLKKDSTFIFLSLWTLRKRFQEWLPCLSQVPLLLGPRWMGKIKLSISQHDIVNFQFSLDDHLATLCETDYYERQDRSSFPLPTIILLSNLTHSNFLSRFRVQKLRQPRNWEEWNVEILKILSITTRYIIWPPSNGNHKGWDLFNANIALECSALVPIFKVTIPCYD